MVADCTVLRGTWTPLFSVNLLCNKSWHLSPFTQVEGGRPFTVYFIAETAAAMPWSFTPQQKYVKVVPGETALAFYTAHNPTSVPVTGVSTYNVNPARAGLYFHKIQCFCFEEQRLRPHEEIDMPVFFYIDPAILNDPAMANVKSISLAYTFFRTGEGDTDASLEGGKGGFDMEAAQAAQQRQLDLMRANPAAGMDVDKDAASQQARIAAWTREMAGTLGVKMPGEGGPAAVVTATASPAGPGPGTPGPVSSGGSSGAAQTAASLPVKER